MEAEVEAIGLDDTSREVIQRLVEEKRRLLEAAAPKISLQDFIEGGQTVLQQNIDRMRDVAAEGTPAPPTTAWAEPSLGLAAAAVAVAAQEGAAWAADGDGTADSASEPLPSSAPTPLMSPAAAAAAVGPPSQPLRAPPPAEAPGRMSCGGASERSLCSSAGAPALHRSSEAAQLRAQRLQQELQLRELRECTFQPRTNRREPVGPGSQDKFVERSQQWRDKRQAEKDAKRREREQEQMEACTFRPSLTPRLHAPPAAAPPAVAAEVPTGDAAGGDERGVVERLYQPQARRALEASQREAREQRRRDEEAECSFQPQTTRPCRTNLAATDVQPRYRQAAPKPEKARPLPSGEEHCTFSPQVNRVPSRLSSAAAEYLDGDAYARLARRGGAPPSPRVPASELSAASDGRVAAAARPLRRSASAPRERLLAPRGARDEGGEPGGGGGGGGWSDFHERQQRFQERKRLAERQRLDAAAAAANQQPQLSRGAQRLGVAQTPFLQRMHRAHQAVSRAGEQLPSNEAADCTFAPRITDAARTRRGRTAAEMSDGDRQRREAAAEQRRLQKESEAAEFAYRPTINAVPGVQSRLKVASEPDSYIARVQQHMRLKDKVTDCVRQAEEDKQMRECTFHPQTHDAPAYVTRIAKSMALAKAGRPAPPPEKPGWR